MRLLLGKRGPGHTAERGETQATGQDAVIIKLSKLGESDRCQRLGHEDEIRYDNP